MTESFSSRHGYLVPAPPITIHEDAPFELRSAIPAIAEKLDMTPFTMPRLVCDILRKSSDRNNWSGLYVRYEVSELIESAPWNKVYDIIESFYGEFSNQQSIRRVEYAEIAGESPYDYLSESQSSLADDFQQIMNEFFVDNGIGWELRNGQVVRRGSETFAKSAHEVPGHLDNVGFPRAAAEMREAVADISRRPDPDVTGAINHAMGALEAIAREITGNSKATLGTLVQRLKLPTHLDVATSKLWSFASDHARHIHERKSVDLSEAELVVAVAGALCDFVMRRKAG